ncbi:Protein MAIN-LIKE 2 [Glycine max]|nr:Protein MAIN-LIKE 2 [Glycine max]
MRYSWMHFCGLTQIRSYAWGVVALVHMYENLNDGSKSSARQLVGYITLLQCWIYEHFPYVSSSIAAKDYHESKSHACRWKSGKTLPMSTYRKCLDRLASDVVCWIPCDDHCVFREFELISSFSTHIRCGPSIIILWPKRVVRQYV